MAVGQAIQRPEGDGRAARGWRQTLRLPSWLPSGAVYAVLIVLCAVSAYWLMFSQFQPYDDEGFFDYSLKLFLAGHHLYNSDFSDYGPFYYELFGGLFALIGHQITTDAGRFVQLAVWLLSSLGMGVAAQRLTGRLSLGVVALVTSFGLMGTLINEPMHPEALICGLLAVCALGAAELTRRPRVGLCTLGAATAALVLTKINVGGYAVIPIGFALVLAGRSLSRYRVLFWIACLAFVLVGPAVMTGKLDDAPTRMYALLAAGSSLAVVFVAAPRNREVAERDESLQWLTWLVVGFAVTFVIVVGIIFAFGSTPGALFNSIVVVPSHQSNLLYTPVTLDGDVVWWGLISLVVAWALRQSGWLHAPPEDRAASIIAWAPRLFAGVAILLSLGSQYPFNILPNAPFALAMPLTWVAAWPSRRDPPIAIARLARLVIPALAITQALLAYPVGGSQLSLGSVLFPLCGVICLADGVIELIAWNEGRASTGAVGRGSVVALVTAGMLALAAGTTFQYVLEPIQTAHDQYRAGVPLHAQGATRLHIVAPNAEVFDQVVATLRAHCHTLIGLPGLYSFDLWTGLPAPSPMTGGQPWWKVLTSTQEKTTLRQALTSPGLCALRDPLDAAGYGGVPSPHLPLVSFIENDFKPILTAGSYTVAVRR